MAKDRLFDGLCYGAVDHIAARDIKDNEGKEVASYIPSWLELRWARSRAKSFDEPGLRFALRLQHGDVLRETTFLQRINAPLPATTMAWFQDHAPEGDGKPARPYVGWDGRRLRAAARCFLPRHDPTVVAGMEGLIMVEEFHFPTMEELMSAKFTPKSFADKQRRSLNPKEFGGAHYIGVDIGPREDGTLGPLGFVLVRAPYLREEGENLRVVREGAVVYLYPEAVATLAEAHTWATWEVPAAFVGQPDDEEEQKLLPASTESGKAITSDGTPSVTSPGGST